MGNHNTHKMMTFNETHLTVAIADLIISEGLSFNIAQKPRFKKFLDLARNVSKRLSTFKHKSYIQGFLDVIHDHNMERNLILIRM